MKFTLKLLVLLAITNQILNYKINLATDSPEGLTVMNSTSMKPNTVISKDKSSISLKKGTVISLQANNLVLLYEKANFEGQVKVLSNQSSKPMKLTLDSSASSLRLVKSSTAALFSSPGFKGKRTDITKETKRLSEAESYVSSNISLAKTTPSGTVFVVSPFEVTPQLEATMSHRIVQISLSVIFYSDDKYSSPYKKMVEDQPTVNKQEAANFLSMTLSPDTTIVVFDDFNYAGKYKVFRDKAAKDPFFTTIRSFRLVRNNSLTFFSECNFKGTKTAYENTFISDNISSDNGKLTFKSFINSGLKAIVAEESNVFGGEILEISSQKEENCLSDKKINTQFQSIRLNYAAPALEEGTVRLWFQTGFKSWWFDFTEDNLDLGSLTGKFNSLQLGANTKALLVDSNNTAVSVEEDIKDLSSTVIIANLTGIRVINKGCVTFFEECGFRGKKDELCDNTDVEFTNLKGKSLISSNSTILLYDGPGFTGTNKSVMQDETVNCLTDQGFSGLWLSYKMNQIPGKLNGNCIRLFLDKDFKGWYNDICDDISQLSGFDNKASSVKVGANVRALLFNDPAFGGEYDEITNSVSDLTNDSFNDSVSSIRILKKSAVYLFDGKSFSGNKISVLGVNMTVLGSLSVGVEVKSAYTSEQQAILFTQSNFGGDFILLRPNSTFEDFEKSGWPSTFNSCKLHSYEGAVSKGEVIFYFGENYADWAFKYNETKTSLDAFKNRFNSAKVGANSIVIAYEKSEYQGKSIVIADKVNQFTRTQGKINSFRLFSDKCVFAFNKCNFQGEITEFCGNENIRNNSKIIKSYISIGKRAALFETDQFSGKLESIDGTVSKRCLEGNTVFKSIKLQFTETELDDNCIRIYSSPSFKGVYQDFCDERFEYKNKVGSIRLGKKSRLVLYIATKSKFITEDLAETVQNTTKFMRIAANSVYFFESNEFKGKYVVLTGSTNNPAYKMNFSFKSFISFKKEVLIFSGKNYSGTNMLILRNTSDNQFTGKLAKIGSFVGKQKESQLQSNCARFYYNKNYSGWYFDYCEDTSELDNQDNEFSSVKLGSEIILVAFNKSEFDGDQIELRQSAENFLENGFDDSISSFRLLSTKCTYVYEECEFSGKMTKICAGATPPSKISLNSYRGGSNAFYLQKGNKIEEGIIRLLNNTSQVCIDDSVDTIATVKTLSAVADTKLADTGFRLYFGLKYTSFYYDFTASISKFGKLSGEFVSLKLGKGIICILYEKEGFEGKQRVYRWNTREIKKIRNFKSFRVIKTKCVHLFSKCNYKGDIQSICDTKSVADIKNKFIGKKGSILGSNYHSVLYEEKNFKVKNNKLLQINGNTSKSCVKLIWNSMKVVEKSKKPKKNCVKFYTDRALEGESDEYCKDNMSLPTGYASVEINQATILVSNKPNLQGNLGYFVKRSQYEFDSRGVNPAQSVKFIDLNCCYLYEKSGFEGKETKICKDTVGKDTSVGKIGSFICGSKKMMFYENKNYQGRVLFGNYYSTSKQILYDTPFNCCSVRYFSKQPNLEKGCVRFSRSKNSSSVWYDYCEEAENTGEIDKYAKYFFVNKDITVVLYSETGFKGDIYILKPASNKKRYDFDNKQGEIKVNGKKIKIKSFLLVKESCLYSFENTGFIGKHQKMCSDTNIPSIKQSIKSVIANKQKIIAYSLENYRGNTFEIANTTEIADLQVDNYFPDFKSVRLELKPDELDDNCVRVYTKKDFKGAYYEYCEDVSKVKFTKTTFGSIKTGKNRALLIFGKSDYTGKVNYITKEASDWAKQGYMATFLSLRVLDHNAIYLFEKTDYQGAYRELVETEANAMKSQLSFTFTSFIAGNKAAVSFEHSDFKGKWQYFFKNTHSTKADKMGIVNTMNSITFSKAVIDNLEERCVFLYEHYDYKGQYLHVCSDASDLDYFSKKVSGIQLTPNTYVLAYTQPNFKGDPTIIRDSVPRAGSIKLNDKIKSIRVLHSNCLAAFSECKYKGVLSHVCSSVEDLKAVAVKSFILNRAVVELHEETGFKGKSLLGEPGTENECIKAVKTVKSVKMIKEETDLKDKCVRLYAKPGFKGNWADVCKDNKDTKELTQFSVQSVRTSSDTFLVLFDDIDYTGNYYVSRADLNDLNGLNGFGGLSSLRLAFNYCFTQFSNTKFGGDKTVSCSTPGNDIQFDTSDTEFSGITGDNSASVSVSTFNYNMGTNLTHDRMSFIGDEPFTSECNCVARDKSEEECDTTKCTNGCNEDGSCKPIAVPVPTLNPIVGTSKPKPTITPVKTTPPCDTTKCTNGCNKDGSCKPKPKPTPKPTPSPKPTPKPVTPLKPIISKKEEPQPKINLLPSPQSLGQGGSSNGSVGLIPQAIPQIPVYSEEARPVGRLEDDLPPKEEDCDCIKTFEFPDFQGSQTKVCDLSQLFRKKVGSLILPSNSQLNLYSKFNYKGNKAVASRRIRNFPSIRKIYKSAKLKRD